MAPSPMTAMQLLTVFPVSCLPTDMPRAALQKSEIKVSFLAIRVHGIAQFRGVSRISHIKTFYLIPV